MKKFKFPNEIYVEPSTADSGPEFDGFSRDKLQETFETDASVVAVYRLVEVGKIKVGKRPVTFIATKGKKKYSPQMQLQVLERRAKNDGLDEAESDRYKRLIKRVKHTGGPPYSGSKKK